MLLEIKGLSKNFGGLAAIRNLDMYVREGELVGLMGPNGAGKTTVINLISGFLRPSSGQILYAGKRISGMAPHRIAEAGIGRTTQFAYLFPEFTVLENVIAASYLQSRCGFFEDLFNTHSYRQKEEKILEDAMQILQLVGLDREKDVLGKRLPHGPQKLLTMARALAIKPKLLLLDEPVGGMSYEETGRVVTAIERIRSRGTTVVIVEHNMRIMQLCERIVVINFGEKISEGCYGDVVKDEQVMRAYFGQEHAS